MGEALQPVCSRARESSRVGRLVFGVSLAVHAFWPKLLVQETVCQVFYWCLEPPPAFLLRIEVEVGIY